MLVIEKKNLIIPTRFDVEVTTSPHFTCSLCIKREYYDAETDDFACLDHSHCFPTPQLKQSRELHFALRIICFCIQSFHLFPQTPKYWLLLGLCNCKVSETEQFIVLFYIPYPQKKKKKTNVHSVYVTGESWKVLPFLSYRFAHKA